MYNLFVRIYYLGVCVASLWNKKARLWRKGRQNWEERLSKAITGGEQYIWMHCSSAGEFEQGKPLAEALKTSHPEYKLLLTFFSPSGYAAADNYAAADVVSYLPLDTERNAQRFVELVNPRLAIFVKYEFWYHHLSAASLHGVPLLLVSAAFRQQQVFFKSYGSFFRRMLRLFQHIFVQDATSLQLLKASGIVQCSVSGDTRFDRVSEISRRSNAVPLIETFLQKKPAVIAGSTWEDDEALLKDFIASTADAKLILAPHEVNEGHLQSVKSLYPTAVMYSSMTEVSQVTDAQVLIVDTVGLLSRLYQHAAVTYVGGGFTKDGIHNVLEAAVWAKPVIFGPNHKKYREAAGLIAAGGGFSVTDAAQFQTTANDLLANEQKRQVAGENAVAYVNENTGATARVIQYIRRNVF